MNQQINTRHNREEFFAVFLYYWYTVDWQQSMFKQIHSTGWGELDCLFPFRFVKIFHFILSHTLHSTNTGIAVKCWQCLVLRRRAIQKKQVGKLGKRIYSFWAHRESPFFQELVMSKTLWQRLDFCKLLSQLCWILEIIWNVFEPGRSV